jgi:NAD(P)-dependent dehydrogenase (short-subunit alcohol dehydrogenase family)
VVVKTIYMNTITIANNYNGALQTPLHSGFSSTTTAADVIKGIDLTGKTAIITGGYAGIGLETTKTLVKAGAEVWVPARDVNKALKNLKDIPNVTVVAMDLANPESIDHFAKQFLAMNTPLHILINNAGIMWVPLRRDSKGYESQFSTNHLGHFHLTAKLWPALKMAGGARVVNVSSFGHQESPVVFEDPNFENREYQTLAGYGQSKTANILFALELDKRGAEYGVRAYSLHPGAVGNTDLGREAPVELFQQMGMLDADGNLKPELAATLKTVPQGAATNIFCAVHPMLDELGGVYCEDADVAVIDNGDIEHQYDDPKTMRGVKPYALDKTNAKKLWALSEKMTNITFAVA